MVAETDEHRLQLLRRNTSAAADAQRQDLRHKAQSGGIMGTHIHNDVRCLCVLCQLHPGGRLALNRKQGIYGHLLTRKPFCGDILDPLRLKHPKILPSRPVVHGKHTVHVRGSGDDGCPAAEGGDLSGKGIGTSQMTGHQRDDKAPSLVQRYNGRILRFAFQILILNPLRN